LIDFSLKGSHVTSGVTRGLRQGAKPSWSGSTGHRSGPTSQNSEKVKKW